jgi:hypothetical protein
MATSEERRRVVYDSFEAAIGTEATDFMMDRLLEHPRGDFATRDDVLAMATVLRGEMAELRGELRGEMSHLRIEMADLRSELRGEMADLRGELRGDMAALSLSVGRELRNHFRATMLALAAYFVALVLVGLYV